MAKTKLEKERKQIESCLRDEPGAFKEIYDELAHKMYPICLRYLRTEDDAKDVLQDAFIRIYKNLKQFKFNGSFEGWCRRIVVNTSIEKIRKNGRLAEDSVDSVPEIPIEPSSFENLKYQDLMALVQSLPDGYRTVFNMYVIEGYSHKEIAEIIGSSESTSKTQLYKARLALQRKLNGKKY